MLRSAEGSVLVNLATSTLLFCTVAVVRTDYSERRQRDNFLVRDVDSWPTFFLGEVKTMPPSQPCLPEEEILGRVLPRVAGSVCGLLMLMDLWQGGHGTFHGRELLVV